MSSGYFQIASFSSCSLVFLYKILHDSICTIIIMSCQSFLYARQWSLKRQNSPGPMESHCNGFRCCIKVWLVEGIRLLLKVEKVISCLKGTTATSVIRFIPPSHRIYSTGPQRFKDFHVLYSQSPPVGSVYMQRWSWYIRTHCCTVPSTWWSSHGKGQALVGLRCAGNFSGIVPAPHR